MKIICASVACFVALSAFANNSFRSYPYYERQTLEDQLTDLDRFNQQQQQFYSRGTIQADQFGNGYTYRDSNGHGSHIYTHDCFGGQTYVDNW